MCDCKEKTVTNVIATCLRDLLNLSVVDDEDLVLDLFEDVYDSYYTYRLGVTEREQVTEPEKTVVAEAKPETADGAKYRFYTMNKDVGETNIRYNKQNY